MTGNWKQRLRKKKRVAEISNQSSIVTFHVYGGCQCNHRRCQPHLAGQLASSTRSPPLSLQSSLHQHPLAHTPTHPLGASPALQLDLTTHHRTHPRQIPVANDSSAAPDSGVFSDQPLVWPPTILSPTAVGALQSPPCGLSSTIHQLSMSLHGSCGHNNAKRAHTIHRTRRRALQILH